MEISGALNWTCDLKVQMKDIIIIIIISNLCFKFYFTQFNSVTLLE